MDRSKAEEDGAEDEAEEAAAGTGGAGAGSGREDGLKPGNCDALSAANGCDVENRRPDAGLTAMESGKRGNRLWPEAGDSGEQCRPCWCSRNERGEREERLECSSRLGGIRSAVLPTESNGAVR